MSLPPPIFDGFFRNPFGGEMNPIGGIGGMGGEGGVLENIQQQVSENGQALQALQGGIGGLPNTPFRPATLQPLIANEIDPSRPSVDSDRINDILIRFEYDKAVADAKKYRETSPLTQNVLPGEMSFEDFKKNRPGIGFTTERLLSPVAPMPMNPSTDIFNIQTGGPGLMTMPNDLGYTGDTGFYDPRGIPNEKDRIAALSQNVGNRGYTGGGSPPVFDNGVNINQIPQPIYERPGPNIGMDQLFGRAFAGKPI